jgi:hypothetical protein
LRNNEFCTVPVLLLVFNRIDTVKKVLSRLSEVKPTKLYIAADGARKEVASESVIVENVKKYILDNISWECEVHTLFQQENLGCKFAVHTAVQWFFSNEESGIVLEDDIVPTKNFFKFTADMLVKYKSDKRVGSITGRNELGEALSRSGVDYFFASKFFCWGWASWSDRVLDNNVDFRADNYFSKSHISVLKYKEQLLVKGMVGLMKSKQVNSWAYPYDLSFRKKGQLCLIPSKNMVHNIGFEVPGVHSSGNGSDSTPCDSDYIPKFNNELPVLSNNYFMSEFINKRFSHFFLLYIFSYSEYLSVIRKVYKKIRKLIK